MGRDRAVSPTEFWRLHPEEIHWLIAARKQPKMYGKMTEEEVKQIYEEDFGPLEDQPFGSMH